MIVQLHNLATRVVLNGGMRFYRHAPLTCFPLWIKLPTMSLLDRFFVTLYITKIQIRTVSICLKLL